MSRLFAEFTSAEAIVRARSAPRTRASPRWTRSRPIPCRASTPWSPASRPPSACRWRWPASARPPSPSAFNGGAPSVAYPFNSGGRPLFSWPVFLLVPFEVGVFAAALAGLIAFFVHCGLPRLHHPAFGVGGVERASQDRFFLDLRSPQRRRSAHLQDLLCEAGAVSISEAEA